MYIQISKTLFIAVLWLKYNTKTLCWFNMFEYLVKKQIFNLLNLIYRQMQMEKMFVLPSVSKVESHVAVETARVVVVHMPLFRLSSKISVVFLSLWFCLLKAPFEWHFFLCLNFLYFSLLNADSLLRDKFILKKLIFDRFWFFSRSEKWISA